MSGPWSEAKLAIAKLVAPLSLWMAAGWSAYPYGMEYVTRLSGELDQIDLPEIRGFSIAASLTCIAVAAISAGYYLMMRGEFKDSPVPPPVRCPYCDTDNPAGATSCTTCGRRMA
ncbi:MAG: hypothetical protein V1934_03715 [Methanobacteriota archaeon]